MTTATLHPSEEYYVAPNGTPYPRLTSILQGVGIVDYSKVPQQQREFAMDRGKKVHRALELFDQGRLKEETLDDALRPYLAGYKTFLDDFLPDWEHIEFAVADEVYGFACTVDRAGIMHGENVVVEIKTGSGAAEDWWGLQIAGQDIALGGPARRRFAVQLPGDGTYKFHEFKDRLDRQVFLAAVAVFRWKQNKGA